MDFWDLTKLLVRRSAVALPLLLLSAATSVWVVEQVNPNYIATAYVQLVPPVPQPAEPGQPAPEQRNPWLEDLKAIGNAATVTVTDQAVIKEMKAAGYSDSFTVEMGSSSAMVSFEVVDDSEQQARETADQLVRRYMQSVTALQTAYAVPSADLISTRRLDLGTNVKESDSKVKRALLAVAAAGLLMTVAVTVGVDAWLRRRSRRRGDAKSTPPTPSVASAGGASPPPAVDVADPAPTGDDRIPIRQASKGREVNGGTPVGVTGGSLKPTAQSSDRRLFGRLRSKPGDVEDVDQTARRGNVPVEGSVVLPSVLPGQDR